MLLFVRATVLGLLLLVLLAAVGVAGDKSPLLLLCLGLDCSTASVLHHSYNASLLSSEAFQRVAGGLLDAEKRGVQVSSVVMLAGQRDVLQPRLSAGQVVSNLLAILGTVQAYDARIVRVACTLPPCGAYDEAGEARRAEINQGLRDHVASVAGPIVLLDLADMAALADKDAWSAETEAVGGSERGGCSLSAQGSAAVVEAAMRLLAAAPPSNNTTTTTTNTTTTTANNTNGPTIDLLPLCSASTALAGSQNHTTNAYARGQWLLLPAKPPGPSSQPANNKTFACCEKSLYNPAEPGVCRATATLREKVNEGVPHLVTQCGDGCCGCDVRDGTRHTLAMRERFAWRPEGCRLGPWSGAEFCRVLGARTLLLSGDSTMEQAFITLTSLLATDPDPRAACVERVKYGWSSHLMTSRFHNNMPDYLAQVKPEVAVFTVGAHLQDHGDLQVILDLLEKELRPWSSPSGGGSVGSNASAPLLIWKSQSPAHVGCHRWSTPYPYGFSYSDAEVAELKFKNWVLFREFDQVTRLRADRLGWRYLDMSPLYYRPDGHIRGPKDDCLHYCLPGPVNLFAQLLLHLLFQEEQAVKKNA